MPNPTTYTSSKQVIGLAVEPQQGGATVPAVTMPIDKFEPQDMPVWLDDKALRGAPVETYNRVQGPLKAEFALSGPAFFDTLPYLLNNILGDDVESGTYTGSGTTTLSTGSAVGATTVSTVASIAASTVVQIDTGALSEVRTVASVTGSGPYTLTLSGNPLKVAHASAAVVKPIQTPFTHAFSVLNAGASQPSSLTITDFQGPTASTGTRAYPGCCLSELVIKGNAESTFIEFDAKGTCWPSASAAAFVSAPSAVQPLAAWRYQLGLAGPASGGTLVKTTSDFEITIKRALQVMWTGQNSQSPYFIQRGKASVSGKLGFVAVQDETPLTYLLNNTQPQMQLLINNGLSGAASLSLQLDAATAAWTTSKIERGKDAVGYQVEFECIANTTNTGWSAGFSPLLATVINNVANNSY